MTIPARQPKVETRSRNQSSLLGLIRFWENPVIIKELRGRMRDRRTFVLLTIYLGLISAFVAIAYLLMTSDASISNFNPNYRQTVGKTIFGTVVMIELLLVNFIGPGLTSGSITSEREHRTLDLLKTTLLSTREFVLGKLGASIIYLLLLIFTVVPIQSLAFILGGVGFTELAISSLMLVVTAVFFTSLGIFFSSTFKRTLAATVTSYGSILLSFLGILFFLFSMAAFESFMYSGSGNNALENLTLLFIWFVISTNPILAAIFTEVILIQDQSILLTNSSVIGNSNFPLPSPWIIYVVTYSILTIIFVGSSILLVRRPEK